MTTPEEHLANADRVAAQRDAARRRLIGELWVLAIMAWFGLLAAWGHAYFALGCRGWWCLLPQ